MTAVPTTPTAAASVGVAMPARMGPSVITVRKTCGASPNVSSTASSRKEPERSLTGKGGPRLGLIRQRMSVHTMKIPASRNPGPKQAA